MMNTITTTTTATTTTFASEYVAVILAGSIGTRLYPVTNDDDNYNNNNDDDNYNNSNIPKHMLPICGIPILLRLLYSIEQCGFIECILLLNKDDTRTMDMFIKSTYPHPYQIITITNSSSTSTTISNNNNNDGNDDVDSYGTITILQSLHMKITIVQYDTPCTGTIDALRRITTTTTTTATTTNTTKVLLHPNSHIVLFPSDLVIFDTIPIQNMIHEHRCSNNIHPQLQYHHHHHNHHHDVMTTTTASASTDNHPFVNSQQQQQQQRHDYYITSNHNHKTQPQLLDPIESLPQQLVGQSLTVSATPNRTATTIVTTSNITTTTTTTTIAATVLLMDVTAMDEATTFHHHHQQQQQQQQPIYKESAKQKKGLFSRDDDDVFYMAIQQCIQHQRNYLYNNNSNTNNTTTCSSSHHQGTNKLINRLIWKQSKFDVEEDKEQIGTTSKVKLPKYRLYYGMDNKNNNNYNNTTLLSTQLSTEWNDVHCYCISAWVLHELNTSPKFILQKKQSSRYQSIQYDLLPLLISRQYRGIQATFYNNKNNKNSSNLKNDKVVSTIMDDTDPNNNTVKTQHSLSSLQQQQQILTSITTTDQNDYIMNDDTYMILAHISNSRTIASNTPAIFRSHTIASYLFANRIMTHELSAQNVIQQQQQQQSSSSSQSAVMIHNNPLLSIPIGTTIQSKFHTIVLPECYIGEKVTFKACVIGRHCTIGNNCRLNNVVVHDHVTIGDNTTLQGTIVGTNVTIGSNCNLNDCQILHHMNVPSNTKKKGEAITSIDE